MILKAFLGFDCRKWPELQKVNMNFSQLFEETTYITYIPHVLQGRQDRGLNFVKYNMAAAAITVAVLSAKNLPWQPCSIDKYSKFLDL